jgi:hypothetical protein
MRATCDAETDEIGGSQATGGSGCGPAGGVQYHPRVQCLEACLQTGPIIFLARHGQSAERHQAVRLKVSAPLVADLQRLS